MAAFERLGPINGLRGLAAIAVYGVHTVANFTAIGALAITFAGFSFSLGSVIWGGWLGVNLFFMLSGFVLYLPYSEIRPYRTADFYKRRFLRLAPLYLVAATTSVFMSAKWDVLQSEVWSALLKVFTVTFYLVPPFNVPGNPPLWSIAVEIYLSLLFPIFVRIIGRFGFSRVLIVSGLLAPTLRALYSATAYEPGPTGIYFPWNLVLIVQSANEFLLGMWLATRYRVGALRTLEPRAGRIFLFTIVAIVILLGIANTSNEAGPLRLLSHLFFLIIDPLLALLIASAIMLRLGIARSTLTCWPLQIIGMMCFSIYVWHMPILNLAANNMPHFNCCGAFNVIGWLPLYAVAFILILGISAITYKFIEFPFRPWTMAFTPPKHQP